MRQKLDIRGSARKSTAPHDGDIGGAFCFSGGLHDGGCYVTAPSVRRCYEAEDFCPAWLLLMPKAKAEGVARTWRATMRMRYDELSGENRRSGRLTQQPELSCQ